MYSWPFSASCYCRSLKLRALFFQTIHCFDILTCRIMRKKRNIDENGKQSACKLPVEENMFEISTTQVHHGHTKHKSSPMSFQKPADVDLTPGRLCTEVLCVGAPHIGTGGCRTTTWSWPFPSVLWRIQQKIRPNHPFATFAFGLRKRFL